MRIATWNVNSLNVRLPQVLGWLAKHAPDILCLQETKLEDGKFPAEDVQRAGYQALYVSAHDLLTQLRAARADETLDRRLQRFITPHLLIVDDLGLRPLSNEEPVDLYEIIRGRYERGSTIITSNRAIEEWPPLFGDLLLASAALDRLLHHAHVIEMDGDTFRNPPPTKRPKSNAARAA